MSADVIDLATRRQAPDPDPVVAELRLTLYVHESGSVDGTIPQVEPEDRALHLRACAKAVRGFLLTLLSELADASDDPDDECALLVEIFSSSRVSSKLFSERVRTPEGFGWLRRRLVQLSRQVDDFEAESRAEAGDGQKR